MRNESLTKYGDFRGKTALITGGTGGLAVNLTKHLLSLDCKVVWACRNFEKARKLIFLIQQEFPCAEIKLFPLDLESRESINNFCDSLASSEIKIDYFVNNAGAFRLDKREIEGFEHHYFVNFYAPILITSKLLEYFDKCKTIVTTVTSVTFKQCALPKACECLKICNNKIKLYAISKRYLSISILLLEKYAKSRGLKVKFTLSHPGVSATNIISNYKSSSFKTAAKNFMTLFFSSPRVSSLSILKAMSANSCEKIYCPRVFQIWGKPKSAKCPKISQKDFELVENELKQI